MKLTQYFKLWIITCIVYNFSCAPSKNKEITMTKFDEAPSWAAEAIWYQIFVERFRSGDEKNNPDIQTTEGALIDNIPNEWSLTPWGHNWYKQEDWASQTGLDFYRTIQMRRYGGDLQGVIDKIDYLKDLGINAVYFNPLNDAPSLHKYDARYYHHIDVCFGNDKAGDMAMIAAENHGDPSSWVWTNADKLFLEVIKRMHDAGIRVIMDFSWNHTGRKFWAFEDIVKNGKNSSYASWFDIKTFDNVETKNNEFDYEGWFGIKSLPEIKKLKESEKTLGHAYEGNVPEEVRQHIYEVCKRWMDPNGDGNISDGIDGMRLDVAEHVPLGFWRDFRKYVRGINPEFYLVGENWWTEWPDKLMDAAPWVKGDVFDAVMHYQWYKPARQYLNQGDDKISLNKLYDHLEFLYSTYRPENQLAMMNLVSSHDCDRVLSALHNSNKYKYQSKPAENKSYYTGKPNALAYEKLYLLLLHQFTFVGAPHIWNGDEMGMWGADDPDNRKPLWWEDIEFENESPLYAEQEKYSDKPQFNTEVFEYYKSLCMLRKKYKSLNYGKCEFDRTLIDQNIFAYKRNHENEALKIYINAGNEEKSISPVSLKNNEVVFKHKGYFENDNLILPSFSAVVIRETL